MKKISILYIISTLTKQGPVQALFDIISNLDYSKFDVTVVTLRAEDNNSILKDFKSLPIKIIQIEDVYNYNFFGFYKRLKAYILQNNIGIVHSQCFRSLIVASFFRKQVICVHSIYIYPGLQAQAMNGKLAGTIMNLITKHLIKKVQYPIACAKNVEDELLKNDGIKVNTIINGGTPPTSISGEKDEIKKLLDLDINTKYLISIGRFSPEKNFATMIEAFKKANLNNYKLIIIGDGKLFDSLTSIINDSIIMPGFKRNIGDYLAASDFYITTSLTEGMALSTVSAMAFGLPLLLSDIPPHTEIFDLAKQNEIGVLFQNNDQNSIVNAIIKIAGDLSYDNLSKNVTGVFNDYFTAKKMSESYQHLYVSAANDK